MHNPTLLLRETLRNSRTPIPDHEQLVAQLSRWSPGDIEELLLQNTKETRIATAEKLACIEIVKKRVFAGLRAIVERIGTPGINRCLITYEGGYGGGFTFTITDSDANEASPVMLTQLADALRAPNGPLEDDIPMFGALQVTNRPATDGGTITVKVPWHAPQNSPAESSRPNWAEIQSARTELQRRMEAATDILKNEEIEAARRLYDNVLKASEAVILTSNIEFIDWSGDIDDFAIRITLEHPEEEMETAKQNKVTLESLYGEKFGRTDAIGDITTEEDGTHTFNVIIDQDIMEKASEAGLI